MRSKGSLFPAAIALFAMLNPLAFGADPPPPRGTEDLQALKNGPLAACNWLLTTDRGTVLNVGILYCAQQNFDDIDLSSRNLAGLSINDSDLRRANFSGSRMNGRVRLTCDNLERADFTNADLDFVDFKSSVLQWANFTGARVAHADLNQGLCRNGSRQDSDYLDDGRHQFTSALGVNMTKARFEYTAIRILDTHQFVRSPPRFEMRRANFTGAQLKSVTLLKVDLRLSTFRDANVSISSFNESNFACSDFTNSQWVGGNTTREADFSGADFTDAKLRGTSFLDGKLTGAVFVRAELTDVGFLGADLTYADFTDAKFLGRIDFREANLSGATWVDGTKCAMGSIGGCTSNGTPAPPDPNRFEDFPTGAAYLLASISPPENEGPPEDSGLYLFCPYSRIDYNASEYDPTDRPESLPPYPWTNKGGVGSEP